MPFNLEILENLLHQPEGPTLDFKWKQYPFNGASEFDKSELLKDILALANSWRFTTAYILIGVREAKGGRSEIVGVQEHLDDAILHQFVNSKTQRPINFSYSIFSAEGAKIGVIQIPVQDRPIFLTKPFGKIQAYEIKIRDGSSTRTASPDEIVRMGDDRIFPGTHRPGSQWTDERLVRSLRKSIDSISGLKNVTIETPEFREWHRATLGTIKSAFGDRSLHYWDFRDAVDKLHPRILYGFFGWRIITGSWRGLMKQNLDDVTEVLSSFVNEIEQYGSTAH